MPSESVNETRQRELAIDGVYPNIRLLFALLGNSVRGPLTDQRRQFQFFRAHRSVFAHLGPRDAAAKASPKEPRGTPVEKLARGRRPDRPETRPERRA